MRQIVQQAQTAFGSSSVVAAQDFMEVKVDVPRGSTNNESRQKAVTEAQALEAAAAAADSFLQAARTNR